MKKTKSIFVWCCVYRVGDEFYKLPFKLQNTPIEYFDVIDYLADNTELKFVASDIDELDLIIIDAHDRVCKIIELEPLNFWPNLSEEDLDSLYDLLLSEEDLDYLYDLLLSSLCELEKGGEKKSNGKD